MAAQRKRKTKVADESYSKLDQYAIEIHEFYRSLRKAGFTVDNALWLASSRECYPSHDAEQKREELIWQLSFQS